MQTFLPYEDFKKIAECLDDKRLYKQIVECKQILKALEAKKLGTNYGWKNHPAVLMWEGFEDSLRYYQWVMFREWSWRRWRFNVSGEWGINISDIELPHWVYDDNLQVSHRAMLHRKDPEHYSQFELESDEWNSNEYWWPIKSGH